MAMPSKSSALVLNGSTDSAMSGLHEESNINQVFAVNRISYIAL
jgi:hypothetical protein